jgi:alkylation response protein AidB-like acyl-CoA dehydrogenase
MDFTFSDEQELLRTSARQFLQDRYPIERVAEITDGKGFDRGEWSAVAALGWTGISVPEDEGGAGLSLLEEIVVAEELGRAVYPGPFLSTVTLALPILRTLGASDLVRAVVSGERTATVAWASDEGRFDVDPLPKVAWEGERLSGTKLYVPNLGAADLVVVLGNSDGENGAWAIERDAGGVAWRELPTVDATRPMGEVRLDTAPATRLGLLDGTQLATIRDRALATLAAEAVGVGARALELAVEHAGAREQFGKRIGTYQAVSHPLAQTFVDVETARSLAYWAGWAVTERATEAPVAAAAAKGRAAEAAVAACERSIQAHGGIGFTWEHPLHRYYKRALGIAAFLGWGSDHRARVATTLLD